MQTVLRGGLRPHSCSRGRPSSNVCYFRLFSCKYIFSKLRCRWQEEEQVLDRATAHVQRRRLCTPCSSLPNSAQLSRAGRLKRRRALSAFRLRQITADESVCDVTSYRLRMPGGPGGSDSLPAAFLSEPAATSRRCGRRKKKKERKIPQRSLGSVPLTAGAESWNFITGKERPRLWGKPW